jgi:hypothetical protein
MRPLRFASLWLQASLLLWVVYATSERFVREEDIPAYL